MELTEAELVEALDVGVKAERALEKLDKALKDRSASGAAAALNAIQRALEGATGGYAYGSPDDKAAASVADMLKRIQTLRQVIKRGEWSTVTKLVNQLRGLLDMPPVSEFAYSFGDDDGDGLSSGVHDLIEAARAAQAERDGAVDEAERRKDEFISRQREQYGKFVEPADKRTLRERGVDEQKNAVTRRWLDGGTPQVPERNTMHDRAAALDMTLGELYRRAGSAEQMEPTLERLEREHEQRSALEEAQNEVNDRFSTNPIFGM